MPMQILRPEVRAQDDRWGAWLAWVQQEGTVSAFLTVMATPLFKMEINSPVGKR